jgi:ATP-dependent exoDNAse (exonuclease V) beta subunit
LTDDEGTWLAAAIRRDLDGDDDHDGWQPEQIAILAPARTVLQRIGVALANAGIAIPPPGSDGSHRLELNSPTVKLATIHASKGLDFPVVYVAGLTTSDLFGDEAVLRPLLYVGMTRSSFRLVLSTVSGTMHPLIEALPAESYAVTGGAGERFLTGRMLND